MFNYFFALRFYWKFLNYRTIILDLDHLQDSLIVARDYVDVFSLTG